jgi:hypothetical protein
MQSYLSITIMPIVGELESLWHIALDNIDANNENENADTFNSTNLDNVGRHELQHHAH